nr:monovalent cation/H(+) antiporter subunit G [Desulfobulbaceae bacterium]
MIEICGAFLVSIGVLFFLSGTIGLLRLPDIYTRLHALTKADNVGLGFVVLGLAIQATSWSEVIRLVLIWFLVLLASAISCHLVADAALRRNIKPWRKR